MANTPPGSVAIIGGGLSGMLTAVHLIRVATRPPTPAQTPSVPLRIFLIQEGPDVGLGVAYGTPFPEHLLNVPAGGMSVFPRDPAHFWRWLQTHYPGQYNAADFAPRRLFGQYARDLWEATRRHPSALVDCVTCHDRAISLTMEAGRARIGLRSGQTVTADRVVLALGNYPPANPVAVEEEWVRKGWYCPNPWDPRYQDAGQVGDLLLIGSGLTALDMVVAYRKRGFRGTVHLVSTHGLLPRVHGAPGDYALSFREDELPVALSAGALYQLFKQELRRAGGDWRAVIGAFRPLTPGLWRRMPVAEQQRFLRRLAPWWNVHRHRVAPSIHALVEELRAEGRLRVWKGRVSSLRRGADGLVAEISAAGGPQTLAVQRVINCTGPQSDYRQIARQDALVASLLSQSLVRPDPLWAGLDALPNGQLRRADGSPSPTLFTLGTPMRGILFECTSVPEIRQQAAELAERLLRPD
ncbi:MAG: FAD/NAD(P)-binding protein [Ferruginibacter sp.]|nr:FAD/NAD(P)-binding protein [Cytophagales bacterium]